jgi:uncharacterized membrane protein
LLRLVKGTPKAPGVGWPSSLISPVGFLLVVSHLFAIPVLVLWVGLKKEYITKIEYEKYFCMITHILGTAGDALLRMGHLQCLEATHKNLVILV